jgi:hypothetical protein
VASPVIFTSWGKQGVTYALLCGILLAKEANMKTLKIIRDSMVVIKSMLQKITPMDRKLVSLLLELKKEVSSLIETSFFHLERDLNLVVDQWANKATKLNIGVYMKNRGHHSCFIA